ncbi:MAG: hypothetical protein HQL27_09535 [Candidatus Omnitrophica bacterium]|nr:hypothetical protein [Candidatus Omnitrophota bacterium]
MVNKRRLVWSISLVLLVLFLAGINHPPIITVWESSVIYNNFLPYKKPALYIGIQPGGDSVGFHGGGRNLTYTVLTSTRWIADLLGHNLKILDLLPISYGLLSLFILYVIVKRWFGLNPAVLSVVILASNPSFLFFQHTLVIQVFSVMSIFFCIERMQNLYEKKSNMAAVTFGFACAVAATNYLISRIAMVAIILFYLLCLKENFADRASKENLITAFRDRLKLALIAFFSMVAILIVFFPANVFLLFNKTFIFSGLGEYATTLKDTIGGILYNLKYIYDFYLPGLKSLNRISELIVYNQYPLENKVLIPFFFLGIAICVKGIFDRKKIFFLYLFSFIVISLLWSFYDTSKAYTNSSSLHVYRIFCLIPFMAVFIALGINCFYERMGKRSFVVKKALIILFVLFMTIRIASYRSEVNAFKRMVESAPFNFNEPAVEIPGKGLVTVEERRNLFINQAYFYQLARYIENRLTYFPSDKYTRIIVYLPPKFYTPAFYEYGGGDIPRKDHPYYLKMFLTFYLNDLGIKTTYLANNENLDTFWQRILEKDVNNRRVKRVLRMLRSNPSTEKIMKIIDKPYQIPKDRQINDKYFLAETGINNPRIILVTDWNEMIEVKTFFNKARVLALPKGGNMPKALQAPQEEQK